MKLRVSLPDIQPKSSRFRRRALGLLVLSGLALGSPELSAAPPLPSPGPTQIESVGDSLITGGPGDGVYGRFNGNFSFSLGLGGNYRSATEQFMPQASFTARYFQVLGLLVGFSQAIDEEPGIERSLEIAALIEPLFLLRFARGKESGHPFWDLTLDSLSLSIGAYLDEPKAGNFADASGLSTGLGLGFPLLSKAPGPWLRLRGTVQTGWPHVQATAHLMLEWQWMASIAQQNP